ncbi:beta-galactosidase [Oleiagrimonas sp. C23AA]|uniref:glycoside hydrolase family 35 protein n=1 Tax=Oleiagrimonas sp. C23AA TaxID=2719047 RepID=UPI001422AB92|nr:beta-galactosidase [Oleiagrimonas sp. C23AA]NII10786.1 beta-galactosidase [Oleiagrimonas sp. C23AA]
MRRVVSSLLMAAVLAMPTAWPAPAAAAGHHRIGYDHYSLKIDGKRLYMWSGSFHYWRLPSPDLWLDVLEKMKAGGYNAVEIYFNWAYHSPRRGVYDFHGIRNVDRLLDMAAKVGIYVIARPGPYINAETDGGGLPAWLATEAGRPRSPAPDYTAAYRQWLRHIDPIIARHQLSNGTGTVILYQVENELWNHSPENHRYMRAIERQARADGITVPLMGNHNAGFQGGIGAVELPGYDSYPLGFDCSHPGRWKGFYAYHDERQALTKSPLFFPEYQGGAFDTWGGAGYAACRKLTGPAFERVFYESNIAAGSTMQNFYMTYGGSNWGWLASPGVYSSYDYGAAITEARRLTPKYAQQKLIGTLLASVPAIDKTDVFTTPAPDNTALQVVGRVNPDNGTRFYFLRHADVTSRSDEFTHLRVQVADAPGAATHALRIPQQAGSTLRIHGRDAKILLADYRFGRQYLVYSTSDWLTSVTADGRDIAVLYGRKGEAGETVLHVARRPQVHVLDGQVSSHWDAHLHSLRLDYRHGQLARVLVDGGRRPLLLLIGDNAVAERFWRVDTAHGPLLVRGAYLLRSARVTGDEIALRGDTTAPGPVEVFAPQGVHDLRWNGRAIATQATASHSLTASLPGPRPVTLPTLAHWRMHAGAPEIAPGFDDSRWRRTDLKHTGNPFWDGRLPILNADAYGFHHGNVWYRGRFTATGSERNLLLDAHTGIHDGNHGVLSVWLNGHWLGTRSGGERKFVIAPDQLKVGQDNVLSVLVSNMGHNQEGHSGDSQEPRGLTAATLTGALTPIRWRIQGARGGETPPNLVRGPMNNGGLYGERAGWSLPGYPDAHWASVKLPQKVATPGVVWYRTSATLDLPADQDLPVAVKISDTPDRHYRALIFVNGWQVGRYINDTGPQHVFPVPTGILDPRGRNSIAIAVWNTAERGGLGKVSLVAQGNTLTPLRVHLNDSPAFKLGSRRQP